MAESFMSSSRIKIKHCYIFVSPLRIPLRVPLILICPVPLLFDNTTPQLIFLHSTAPGIEEASLQLIFASLRPTVTPYPLLYSLYCTICLSPAESPLNLAPLSCFPFPPMLLTRGKPALRRLRCVSCVPRLLTSKKTLWKVGRVTDWKS